VSRVHHHNFRSGRTFERTAASKELRSFSQRVTNARLACSPCSSGTRFGSGSDLGPAERVIVGSLDRIARQVAQWHQNGSVLVPLGGLLAIWLAALIAADDVHRY
jgi:hypothetical protein